ncbi:MAG: zinc metallopeptidase [bacterium]|nr:zinc metallopeptidase [bacterium]
MQTILSFYPLFYDPYMLLLIPPLILAFWAQAKVRSAFRHYSQVGSVKGYSGAEAAAAILRNHGLHDVRVEQIEGQLTDHYDPRDKVLRLSTEVYRGRSLAAVGVAAHEAGHALQHARGYVPLRIRSAIVPAAGLGTSAAPILFLIGLFARSPLLMDIAIIGFAAAAFFYVVTLPVEYNASSRAIQTLRNEAIILENEKTDTKRVLNAAALTYLAAALMAVMQLVRFILLRNDRR